MLSRITSRSTRVGGIRDPCDGRGASQRSQFALVGEDEFWTPSPSQLGIPLQPGHRFRGRTEIPSLDLWRENHVPMLTRRRWHFCLGDDLDWGYFTRRRCR